MCQQNQQKSQTSVTKAEHSTEGATRLSSISSFFNLRHHTKKLKATLFNMRIRFPVRAAVNKSTQGRNGSGEDRFEKRQTDCSSSPDRASRSSFFDANSTAHHQHDSSQDYSRLHSNGENNSSTNYKRESGIQSRFCVDTLSTSVPGPNCFPDPDDEYDYSSYTSLKYHQCTGLKTELQRKSTISEQPRNQVPHQTHQRSALSVALSNMEKKNIPVFNVKVLDNTSAIGFGTDDSRLNHGNLISE